jgi:hypothetical protein
VTAGTDESGERVDIDTPPAAGELEAADVAGLFAASLDAGGLDPVPIVAIAGVDVASGHRRGHPHRPGGAGRPGSHLGPR